MLFEISRWIWTFPPDVCHSYLMFCTGDIQDINQLLSQKQNGPSSGRQAWYSWETLTLVFNVFSEYQGCHSEALSVSVMPTCWCANSLWPRPSAGRVLIQQNCYCFKVSLAINGFELYTNLTNPTVHLSRIPQEIFQNNNVHSFALNGEMWDTGQVHREICELDYSSSLQWRHNERNSVLNHQRFDCLLNRLSRHRSKKTSKLRVTGLCEGNSLVTGEFSTQRASNVENVSIWWRHHGWSRSDIYSISPEIARHIAAHQMFILQTWRVRLRIWTFRWLSPRQQYLQC